MRRLVMLLAWLVCIGAWLRLYTMALRQMPPAREVRAREGAPAFGHLACAGPALLAGSTLVELCREGRGAKGALRLLRIDITRHEGVAMALPAGTSGPLRAATRDRKGQIVLRIGGAAGLYRVGLSRLEPLSKASPARGERLAGLGWVGDHVEWALASGKRCAPSTKDRAGYTCSALPAPSDDAESKSWLAAVRWQGETLHTLWLRAPRKPRADARVELLEGSASGTPMGRWSHPIAHDKTQHALHDGAGLLLGAASGLLRDTREAPPFVPHGSQWRALPMPDGYRAGDTIALDYVLDAAGRAHALPRVARLNTVRVEPGEWIRLGGGADRGHEAWLERRAPRKTDGPAILARLWLGKSLRLLPVDKAHGGGLLLLGRHGVALARVDHKTLERRDAPGFFERLAMLFHDDCAKRQRGFYDELAWLKMASVPFVLLALPLLFLPFSMLAYRRRLAGRAPGYLPVLVPYLVGAAALAPWYWKLTSFI
ncbi:MAG: hypothetical protein KC503_36175 [Myxococcales bacterium]|nr:hypothetical protein [Myxococcales bacterium]